jgi:hypothetical protein
MGKEWLDALERWHPDVSPPPNLYFGVEDVDAIRSRTGAFPLLWERIRATALSALEEDPEPHENQVYTIRHWLGVAGAQALVGLVDNWPELQARAWELLQIAFEHDDWVIEPHKPLRVDLFYAAICAELGQLYDWLYPVLTPAQRDTLVGELKRRIAPFEAITAREAEDWDVHHWVIRNTNWKSVVHSEMGIAALAVRDHMETLPAILRAALKGVLEVLDDPHVTGEDGAYTEGLSYWGYAMSRTLWFAGLLKRATDGAVDLFEHPYLRTTGDYALHMWTPDGGSFAHEDCPSDRLPHPMVMATLAAENQRGDYQWMAQRSLAAMDGFSHEMLVQFLFADPALEPRRPDLPTGRVFPSIETAVARSDWTDDATFLGFHAGATQVPHSHLDIGTFTLIGRGERLIDDAGKWPYDHAAGFFDNSGPRWHYEANNTAGHNTVLVDGQGQVFGEGCEGRIVASNLGGEIDTLIADITDAYDGRLSRFVRYVAYLKPDVVVIVDDLVANEASDFSWLLHTGGVATLNDTDWTFESGDAAVDVRILGFDELGDTGGYMTGWVDRQAHYEEYNHLYVTPANCYAVFETLHPEPAWLVPAVLRVRNRWIDLPMNAVMTRTDDVVTIEVSAESTSGGMTWLITIDLTERAIRATSG